MAILNYSTKIDPIKTIGEIQACLARHGATNISIDFASKQPSAVTFLIEFNGELVNFRLPSNHKGVYAAMVKDRDIPKSFKTEDQARRVSWRIVKDWVEAQLAIVEAGLATTVEVFLPYTVTNSGLTLYESFEKKGFKLIAAESSSLTP